MKRIVLACLFFASLQSVFAADPRIRVLIVDGYSNHDWRLTTALIRGILEPTGLFDVSVSTAPPTKDAPGWDHWRPKFSDHDVVIQTCNDLGGGPRWPQVVEQDFEAFVRGGGGVYVWHAGNNAFAGWPAYNEMIGLGWRKRDFGWALAVGPDGKVIRIPAGEGEDTGHGDRLNTLIHRHGDHPIHQGLPREWLTPDIEVYTYARGPAQNLDVLSSGVDPRTKQLWPLEWTVSHGQGRVYTSTFGHVWQGDTQPERMRCAGLQTVVVRALQWLAGRPADFPVPADFPTAEKISVRGEIPLPAAPFPVIVAVDAAKPLGELKPIWRFFGADEPNYAYMKDGRRLLDDLGALKPKAVYFRAHNLLTTGDGTPALKWGSTNAYTEDAEGRPVYDWTIVDLIFDSYLERGLKPYVEIGFMPKALSTGPEPYQHDWKPNVKSKLNTGWAHPPKDYDKWGELVYQWVRHCVERYGRAEVESWYWEVWNEANYPAYWNGTVEEFFKTHDYAIAAVRRALPTARVGGPDTAGPGGKFMTDFLDHAIRGKNHATGEIGTPTDFIAFHAKGQPTFVDGHVRMGIAAQLKNINDGFALIAAVPEMKTKPIIIGESDPDGCAACQGPQLGYRNGTMYSSYTAASFARKHELADLHGVNLEGALTWAFTFEEQPYFAGFRQLASNGVPLPVLNVFRMMSRMEGNRLAATSSAQVPLARIISDGVRGDPDVGVLAARTDRQLTVLLWHYHDDDLAGPAAAIALTLQGLPANLKSARVIQHRIDDLHSNAYTEWLRLGSPPSPTPAQYHQLMAASALATVADSPAAVSVDQGQARLQLTLPRQGVSLLTFTWHE